MTRPSRTHHSATGRATETLPHRLWRRACRLKASLVMTTMPVQCRSSTRAERVQGGGSEAPQNGTHRVSAYAVRRQNRRREPLPFESTRGARRQAGPSAIQRVTSSATVSADATTVGVRMAEANIQPERMSGALT